LDELCGENDIVKFCKLSRLRWAGHVIRQDDDLSRRVHLSQEESAPEGDPGCVGKMQQSWSVETGQ